MRNSDWSSDVCSSNLQKPEGPKKSEIPSFAGTTRACLAPPASEAPFTPTGNARKTRLLTEARAAEEQRSGISSHDHLGPGDHRHRHLRDGELESGDGHHLARPGARHQIAGADRRRLPARQPADEIGRAHV